MSTLRRCWNRIVIPSHLDFLKFYLNKKISHYIDIEKFFSGFFRQASQASTSIDIMSKLLKMLVKNQDPESIYHRNLFEAGKNGKNAANRSIRIAKSRLHFLTQIGVGGEYSTLMSKICQKPLDQSKHVEQNLAKKILCSNPIVQYSVIAFNSSNLNLCIK